MEKYEKEEQITAASEQTVTFPFEMYKIRLEDVQITVTCEKCTERGYVSKDCCRCGGKGIHNKTVKKWRIAPELVSIIKIDREKEDSTFKGSLRYWTSLSEFYNEEKRLLHFNKSDAQTECDRRNKI